MREYFTIVHNSTNMIFLQYTVPKDFYARVFFYKQYSTPYTRRVMNYARTSVAVGSGPMDPTTAGSQAADMAAMCLGEEEEEGVLGSR